MNTYKVIIIFATIKPLHPKLAYAFGYRLSLSATMHTQTWPVIVTLMKRALLSTVVYAENFHGGSFIQWHIVVSCICCALFVMSQFDVIFMLPNQRFGEVC